MTSPNFVQNKVVSNLLNKVFIPINWELSTPFGAGLVKIKASGHFIKANGHFIKANSQGQWPFYQGQWPFYALPGSFI